jgi:ribosomal protein S18 acetylase RimI-like enzyme
MPSRERVVSDKAVIRAARFADRAFLRELSVEVFSRYAREPEEVLRRMMDVGTTLVAEHMLAGKAVPLGFACIEVSARRAAVAEFKEPRLAHLSAIAVRPEATRCGLGRQLLEAAEDAAREQGAIAMSLVTATTNHAAQSLFRRAGYQTILPLDAAYRDAQDGVRMLKSLTLAR